MLLTTTLRSMLARKGNVGGTLAAITLAVGIMLGAILVLLSTLSGPGVAARLAATDAVVRPDLAAIFDTPEDSVPVGMHFRVPMEQVRIIEQVDGVDRVIGDVTFAAQVLAEDGAPIQVGDEAVPRGQSWESAALTPFSIADGQPPTGPHDIVIDQETAAAADLRVGQQTQVLTNQSTAVYTVTGIAVPDGGIEFERQSSVFFAPDTARVLAGDNDAVDLAGVFIEDGTDQREVLDRVRVATDDMDLQVLSGADRARADMTAGSLEVLEFGIILGVLSGFVGFVAIFVLLSTIGYSIQQRAREIGLQRAIGYTPRQVRLMIVVETLAIAVLGSAVGVLLGPLVARGFVWIGVRFGGVPESFEASFYPLGVAIVSGAAIGIALVSAWLAGGKTRRIHPIEALRSASAPRVWIGLRRLSLGVLFVVGAIGAVVASASLPTDAAVAMSLLVTALLTTGCALLGPLLAVPFVKLGRVFALRGERITGEMAVSNTRRMAARVASSVTPVVLGVGFLVLMFGFTATMESATLQITEGRETADLHVVASGAALPSGTVDVIGDIEGVERAGAIHAMQVSYVASDFTSTANAAVMSPQAIDAFEDLTFSSGDLASFVPGTVLISNVLEFPGFTGSTITVTMEDGQERELIVAGEVSNLMGLGDIVMTPEDAAGHLVDSTPITIAVDVAAGADVQETAARIEGLAAEGFPVEVLTHDQYVSGVRQTLQDGVWATYLIIGGAAAFGLVATVNTLSMSIAERAREFALMRLIGASSSQVLRMLSKEASIVCLAGLVLGGGIAVLSTAPASVGLVGDLSAMSMPILPAIGTSLVATLVVFGATLSSGMMALRQPPIAEIGRKD